MGMAVVAIGGFAQTHRFCEPGSSGVSHHSHADQRITVTIPSPAHPHLLKWWARTSGRLLSNLASSLLEDGIKQAIRDGRIPEQALKCMNELIDASLEVHSEDWHEDLANVKQAGL